MKLTPTLVDRTLDQFQAEPVPDNHALVPKLNEAFGDHTFFLNGEGLHIVELVADAEAKTGQVVRLASWQDAARTSLAAHSPEPTAVIIALEEAA